MKTVVSYGPCPKCKYVTDCKRKYFNHIMRQTDCTPQRNTEWLIAETRSIHDALVVYLNQLNALPENADIEDFQRLHKTIIRLYRQIRWRMELIAADRAGQTVDELIERFDAAILNADRMYLARTQLAARGVVVGMKAIGTAPPPTEED
jgi:hypothetical protein